MGRRWAFSKSSSAFGMATFHGEKQTPVEDSTMGSGYKTTCTTDAQQSSFGRGTKQIDGQILAIPRPELLTGDDERGAVSVTDEN